MCVMCVCCKLTSSKQKHNTKAMLLTNKEKKTEQRPSNMATSTFVLYALPRAVERVDKSFLVPLGLKISASWSASWSMLHTLETPKLRSDVICLFISL